MPWTGIKNGKITARRVCLVPVEGVVVCDDTCIFISAATASVRYVLLLPPLPLLLCSSSATLFLSTPINKDTIFRIYSMTKPIISVAIMTMVEDGMINLNDPLEKYIPEFANLQVINRESGETRPAESSITIENLLTHESGIIQAIFSPGSDLGKMYANDLQGDLTAQEFAARLGQLPVYFLPNFSLLFFLPIRL